MLLYLALYGVALAEAETKGKLFCASFEKNWLIESFFSVSCVRVIEVHAALELEVAVADIDQVIAAMRHGNGFLRLVDGYLLFHLGIPSNA